MHVWGRELVAGALLASCLVMSPARAQDEEEKGGQAQLDQAIDAKLEAESFEDLGRVIVLCESALEAGLGEDNESFAKRLLASTFMQRASFVFDSLIDLEQPDDNWLQRLRQLRPMAVTDLKKALEYDTKQPEAHYMLGRLLALPGGDREGAIRALGEAITHSGEADLLRADALSARAALHTDPAAKRADFDQALEITGSDADVLLARARFLIQQGEAEAALADCERAAQAEPDSAKSYEVRAVAEVALKRFDAALASLGEVLARNDRQWAAHVQRARLYDMQGETETALADLDQAIEIEPRAAPALLYRAELRQRSGNPEGALADSERLVAVAPKSVPAARLHAVILVQNGQTDRAIRHMERMHESNASNPALALHLAMLYVSDKNAEAAISAYTDVLKLEEESWIARQGRADACLMLGRQVDALADYEQALEIEPESDSTLNNLAWLLATSPDDNLRDGVRALRLATEACRVTEYKKAHILSTLAAAYAELGDFETAIRWTTHAQTLGDEGVQQALENELASYRAGAPWRENQLVEGDPPATTDAPDESTDASETVPPPDEP